jgi:hypothetical protein
MLPVLHIRSGEQRNFWNKCGEGPVLLLGVMFGLDNKSVKMKYYKKKKKFSLPNLCIQKHPFVLTFDWNVVTKGYLSC